MAAFSYLLDSIYQPKSPTINIKATTNSSHFGDSLHCPSNIVFPPEIICSFESSKNFSMSETQMECYSNSEEDVGLVPKSNRSSSSMAEQGQKPRIQKRRNNAQNKSVKEGKVKKQRKCSGGTKEGEEKKKDSEEPPSGYIHVRARRGQATDSHSLAERVRREKISERMKLLQGLVPGCDKVTGKALMLDEIINYVQSLQNQVEFLSMKLASVNPVLYDFGMDLDDYMVQPEKMIRLSPPMPSVPQQFNHIQATAFGSETTNHYPMLNSTTSPFFLHGQGPNAFSQDNEGQFVNQVDQFSSICSFQPHIH
ncbi:hypothetical protein QJS10_CPB04g00139 [Acorus calamus]|uniref:BHLH domain-containing protein n=1 Tax=Acorus calamus TaxID=4465 RepID=A0AAV9EXT1_ACOCL|nr:hypothetical protein QJS10_CPB04g00139 [Acorus calamus]